jgi:hypothetical protein
MMPPVRETGSLLTVAVNSTLPSPWPLDPFVMLSHPTSGCAVHWHSRSVFTVIDPVPPDAGTVEPGASNATEHFALADGDV